MVQVTKYLILSGSIPQKTMVSPRSSAFLPHASGCVVILYRIPPYSVSGWMLVIQQSSICRLILFHLTMKSSPSNSPGRRSYRNGLRCVAGCQKRCSAGGNRLRPSRKSGIGSFCVSGPYICAGVDGLIVIGSDRLIWIGRGLEMEEGAQIDVGSEADRWWIIVGYSDGADVSGAVCGLGEGFMIWGFLSDVVVGGGVYNEKKV